MYPWLHAIHSRPALKSDTVSDMHFVYLIDLIKGAARASVVTFYLCVHKVLVSLNVSTIRFVNLRRHLAACKV